MSASIKIVLLIIFLIIVFSVSAQVHSFRHYTVNDGLVQQQVMAVFQDSKGYIWMGTRGGISRFDGYEFKNYTVKDGLLYNYVYDFAEDKKGNIWMITKKGLSYFDGVHFISYPSDKEIFTWGRFVDRKIDKYPKMYSGSNNIQFVTSFENGIYSIDTSIFKLSDGRISNIKTENEKDFYLSIKSKILYHFYNKAKKNTIISTFKLKTNHNQIQKFDNEILIADSNLIYSFKNNQLKLLTCIANGCQFMYKSEKGKYVFMHTGNLFVIWDGKTDISTIIKTNYKFNETFQMLIDKENNLWIGTEYGLYCYTDFAFQNFVPDIENKMFKNVWCILEDKNNKIWFSSYGYGLQCFNDTFFRYMFTDHLTEKHNGFTMGGIRRRNGNLLFPDGKYLLEWDGNQFTAHKVIDTYYADIESIYEENSRLLLGCRFGLAISENLKKTKNIEFTVDKEALGIVNGIEKDKFGNYWLAAMNGMFVFNDTCIQKMKMNHHIKGLNRNTSIPNINYCTVYRDIKNNMWFGGAAGLFFSDYQNTFGFSDERLAGRVKFILNIDSTTLLIGINSFLTIIDLNDFYKTKNKHSFNKIKIIDKESGFYGQEIVISSAYKDSKNNIWIACKDRVVQFTPSELKMIKSEIPIYFKDVKILNDKMQWKSFLDSSKKSYSEIIKLNNKQNNLRFEFTGIYYTNPNSIKYSYRLIGYQNNWSLPVKERFAVFTNISPGDYIFEVKCATDEDVWNQNPARITVSIIPAWYQTWYFKLSATLLILGSMFFGIRLYYRIKEKQRIEKSRIEQQFAELQLRSIKTLMDPHFTFNVLNTIGSIIYSEDKETAYQTLATFSKILRERLEVSNQNTISLEKELELVKSYLALEKIRFSKHFNYSVEIDESVDLEQEIPKMLIQIFAENSIKHGLKHKLADGFLLIKIYNETSYTIIIIEDNGIGRKKAEELKTRTTGKGTEITNSFFELYNKYRKNKISYEIIDLMNISREATGTRVIIKVPADFKY